MPDAKPYVANIFRTRPPAESRRGLLRLDMNEGIPGLPDDFVREALTGVSGDFVSTYPEYGALVEKIAAHNGIGRDCILLTNGSDAAIKHIFDAYVSGGDRVLLTDPTFAMYPIYCKTVNAVPVGVSYRVDLSFPSNEFLGGITGKTRMAIVVNPNNPTGTAVDQRLLHKIAGKAAKHDVLLVVDEAYYYFHPESFIGEVNCYGNLIVLRTFSKLCGLAAGRLGYAAASPAIIENLRKVRPTYDVNAFAVLLAEALMDRPSLIRKLLRNATQGKRYLIERLQSAGIEHKAGAANFVLIKCSGRVDEIMGRLRAEAVLVGGGFTQGFLKDYIRVTTGSVPFMTRFWRTFHTIWRKLPC